MIKEIQETLDFDTDELDYRETTEFILKLQILDYKSAELLDTNK